MGLKATFLVGLVGAAFTGLVFHLSDPLGLILLAVVLGLAAGPTSTAGQSYLIASVASARMGLGGALYFLSHTLGNSLGSLVTGVLLLTWTLQKLGSAMVGAMVAVCVLGLLLLPGGRPLKKGAVQPGLGLWVAYRPLLSYTNVHLLIALRYSITSFWGMATLVLPLLIFRVSGTKTSVAFYSGLSLAIAAGCQLATGFLRDRYGNFWPALLSSLGVALCALGLSLFHHTLGGLFAFGAALTGTAWALSTIIPSLIDAVAGPQEKNRLVGLAHLVWSAAMVSGNLIGGVLVDLDPALPFLAGTGLGSVGAFCAWLLCRRLATGTASA